MSRKPTSDAEIHPVGAIPDNNLCENVYSPITYRRYTGMVCYCKWHIPKWRIITIAGWPNEILGFDPVFLGISFYCTFGKYDGPD